MQNTILYLIGFGGTGKYTIAKEIVTATGAVLVDNHLILNPVFTVFQPDGKKPIPESVWGAATDIRHAVLRVIEQDVPNDRSFIFTNELTELPEDRAIYENIETLATARNARFIPIRLTCTLAELERRVVSADRAPRYKDVNIESCRNKFTNHTVLKPSHPNLIELDVTSLSAQDAAAIILENIK